MLAAVCDVDRGQGRRPPARRSACRATPTSRRCSPPSSSTRSTSSRARTRIARLRRLTIAHGVATIVQKPFAPTWEDCDRHRRGRAKGRRLARRAREFPLPGADARRAQGDRQRRDRRAELGAHHASAPASTSTRPSPISSTRSGWPSPMSASTCSTSRASSSARSRASPARRSAATRRSRPRTTPRPCCSGTRAARSASSSAPTRRAAADDCVPRDAARDRGRRAARSSSTAGCRMTVTSDGEAERRATSARRCCPGPAHPWHVSQEGAIGACRHFLDCLQRGVPAETRGADNLRTYALVDAAYRAAAEHGRSRRSGGADDALPRRRPVTTVDRAIGGRAAGRQPAASAYRHHRRLRTGGRRLPRSSTGWSRENARAVGRAGARLPALRRAAAGRRRHGPRGLPLRDLHATARPSTCISRRRISRVRRSGRATWCGKKTVNAFTVDQNAKAVTRHDADVGALELFGTDEPTARAPAARRRTAVAPCSKTAICATIRFAGVEIVRAINYLARDASWGTYKPALSNLRHHARRQRLRRRL